MSRITKIITGTYLVLAITLLFNGCTREAGTLEPAPYPSDAEIFIDGFGPGVTYEAFGNSKVDALGIDESDTYSGSSALTITVPAEGDPDGWFAGGAFIAPGGRDLTGFNALTFWAKANQSATVDLFGFGNDNTGNSKYPTELKGFKLNRGWKKFIIPIPLPQKLEIEGGLFYFADGHDNGAGYDIWVDEVQFEKLGTLAHPSATIPSHTFDGEVGDEFMLEGQGTVTFNTGAENVTVHSSLAYFTFSSSDNNVATVDETGKIAAVGLGTATISGKLGTTAADGAVTVNINEAATGPATAAPVPTFDQANVTSLFSNVYTNAVIDTWSADWDVADVEDIQLMDDDTKLYKNLSYAGIEFTSSPIDASAMTNFYMNLWTPDATADPAAFKIKLVDFGADGAYGGGDDTEHEIALTANTNPALASNTWLELDIPLSDFAGLTTTGHLAQMIISGDPNTVYVDNVLFYKDGGGNMVTEPTDAAPDPTQDEANVLSIFSDSYTNVDGTDFNPGWGQTTVVTTVDIGGNNMLNYANFNFQGTQFVGELDASGMAYLHIDMWTSDATVVKFTPISGTTGENLVDLTPIVAGQWNSFDIPLTSFTDAGMSMADLIQLKFDGQAGVTPSNIYLDNIYFYGDGGGNMATEPTEAAPVPTHEAANVISIFSDSYTNVDGTNFNPAWGQTTVVSTEDIGGNNMFKYATFNYQGIELGSAQDASGMTHLHIDMWTSDATVVKVTPISGTTGENLVDLTPIVVGQWNSFDIPLTSFTDAGMSMADLIQLKFDGQAGVTPSNIWLDNIYFH